MLGAVFTLARFSEAFLILRAQDVGLAIAYVPAIMIVMNMVYSVFAYPAGAAADRLAARKLLAFGLGLLVVADIILAVAASPPLAFLGVAFWGLHMAFTQGLLSKLVADTAPSELRGTAFGVFNLVGGVVLSAGQRYRRITLECLRRPGPVYCRSIVRSARRNGIALLPPRVFEPQNPGLGLVIKG